MNVDRECCLIESILAETIGSFLMVGIILSGPPISPHEYEGDRVKNDSYWDQWRDHKMTLKKKTGDRTMFDNAITHGLLVVSTVSYTAPISGGHLNPAITVGALVSGYIKVIPASCYVIGHFVGALLGEVAAQFISGKEVLGKEIYLNAQSDFFLGLLATFLLVSVFLSVSDPRRYWRDIGSAPLAIGLCVTSTLYAMTDYRCTINPAVSLATSVHYSDFRVDWPYWIAPLLGGLLAGLVYRSIIKYYAPSLVHVHRSTSLITITTINQK